MENEQPLSGSTSPTYPRSTTSGESHGGGDDATTAVTTMENVSSVPVPPPFIPPPPPVNTPATQSPAGAMTSLDLSGATAALEALPEADTAASTNTSGISNKSVLDTAEGKDGVEGDEEGSSSRSSTPKSKGKDTISPPNEHVHEASVWEEIAKEDLAKALQRAVQYAIDMHRIDDSRTAQDYYSELVTGVINKGEVEFDKKYLK